MSDERQWILTVYPRKARSLLPDPPSSPTGCSGTSLRSSVGKYEVSVTDLSESHEPHFHQTWWSTSEGDLPKQRDEGGFNVTNGSPINTSEEGMILDFIARIPSQSCFMTNNQSSALLRLSVAYCIKHERRERAFESNLHSPDSSERLQETPMNLASR